MTASKILDKALRGEELSVDDGEALFAMPGGGLCELTGAADEIRRQHCGNAVTYVVNRNINFTNVCVKRCGFCAFSRGHRAEEGYFLPMEEVVRRAREAQELGASEVCLQAGLPPRMKGSYYIDLCRAIKRELPDIHLHAFSPEEVLYGAARSEWTVERYLAALNDAGLGSMPGTSAEILDDDIRELISPGRISTAEWLRVIRAAHGLGIRTSSTIMFGHVESPRHRAAHLALLRDTQKETGGFTEFVPLSFIHTEAPMFQKSLVAGIQPGPSEDDVMRMYAVSRLMLRGWIDNVQASWVKQGPAFAARCLNAGANDFGGTLINESISTAAGAPHGHFLKPSEIRSWIRAAGRVPAERSTVYKILRTFDVEPSQPDALDGITCGSRFGTYHQLTASSEFRFRERSRPQVEG
ncbi:MAG: 5-amino-6-(D-ribitylamino)uracil--L-tyrosine 4-hydroxyphenyl transferase CofH [Bryobacteraceae bacterium]